jgi:hypothetical protein
MKALNSFEAYKCSPKDSEISEMFLLYLPLIGQDENFWENNITGDLPTTFSSPSSNFS